MRSWDRFAAAEPAIAAAGARLFAANDVAFLATVSRTCEPRVHPFCPVIVDGALWAFVIEGSPKRADLDANRRFAIHAWPGAEDEQFYVTGEPRREPDEALREIVLKAMPYSDMDNAHILYEFCPRRALWTTWEKFQQPGMRPVHRRWQAAAISPG